VANALKLLLQSKASHRFSSKINLTSLFCAFTSPLLARLIANLKICLTTSTMLAISMSGSLLMWMLSLAP
jgi:hypothetical protein